MTIPQLPKLLVLVCAWLYYASGSPIAIYPRGTADQAVFPIREGPNIISPAEQESLLLTDESIGSVRLSIEPDMLGLMASPSARYGRPYRLGSGSAFLPMDNPRHGFVAAHDHEAPGGGCQYFRHQVRYGGHDQPAGAGTRIAIGQNNDRHAKLKLISDSLHYGTNGVSSGAAVAAANSTSLPYACGELFWKRERLTYGRYSADIKTPLPARVGHVTGFYLRSRGGDTELDVEMTGLYPNRVWFNIWQGEKQHPVPVTLKFNTSMDWHNYAIEWRPSWVAFAVDGYVLLNRTDVTTTPPQQANYRLSFNAWPQLVHDTTWAGQFQWPNNGDAPEAHFRNFRYEP